MQLDISALPPLIDQLGLLLRSPLLQRQSVARVQRLLTIAKTPTVVGGPVVISSSGPVAAAVGTAAVAAVPAAAIGLGESAALSNSPAGHVPLLRSSETEADSQP
jgi:hypothetical protein